MKFLFTIAKIIPKLGTENEHEKMLALLSIERILKRESLSWTDIGIQVEAFLRETLDFVEEEALAPPKPEPEVSVPVRAHGWQRAPAYTSPGGSSFGSGGSGGWTRPPPVYQPNPAPRQPPPQAPPRPPCPVGFNWKWSFHNNAWEKTIDSRIDGQDKTAKIACINEMLASTAIISGPQAQAIRTTLLAIKIALQAGLSLSAKQLQLWREKSKLL